MFLSVWNKHLSRLFSTMFWLQKHWAPKTLSPFCYMLTFVCRSHKKWTKANFGNFHTSSQNSEYEIFSQSTLFGIFHQSIDLPKTLSNIFYNIFIKSVWLQKHRNPNMVEPFCNTLCFVLYVFGVQMQCELRRPLEFFRLLRKLANLEFC